MKGRLSYAAAPFLCGGAVSEVGRGRVPRPRPCLEKQRTGPEARAVTRHDEAGEFASSATKSIGCRRAIGRVRQPFESCEALFGRCSTEEYSAVPSRMPMR